MHQLEGYSPSSSSAPLLDEGRTKKKAVSLEEVRAIPSERYNITELSHEQRPNPNTKLAWKGVAEIMACDFGVHQIAHLMTEAGGHKGYSSNWKGQLGDTLLRDPQNAAASTNPTVEARLGGGSLDAEWIVIWIKIQCRLLEWARDADPSHLMRVIGKLSRDDHSQECTYDVLDFLRDLGMYTELKYCQERLRRGEGAWFECMMMKKEPWEAGDVTVSSWCLIRIPPTRISSFFRRKVTTSGGSRNLQLLRIGVISWQKLVSLVLRVGDYTSVGGN